MAKEPRTLLEAVTIYSDPQRAHEFVKRLRWPNGVACPRMGCGSADVREILGKRPRWFCRDCEREFTAKVGTIFEDSPIGFDKWLPALWLLSSAKNGISSMELHRALGVTQKTAWFMLHRIRLAMADGDSRPFEGPVEVDETYVGGLTKRNRTPKRRAAYKRNWSEGGKTAILGIVKRGTPQRKSRVRAFVVPFIDSVYLQGNIRRHVMPGSEVHTDGFPAYRGLKKDYIHHVIDHAYEYVRENVHTNSIESFFSVLKRTIEGNVYRPASATLTAVYRGAGLSV